MHDAMSKESDLQLLNKSFGNCYNPHPICRFNSIEKKWKKEKSHEVKHEVG
jgi:hypothetical protein